MHRPALIFTTCLIGPLLIVNVASAQDQPSSQPTYTEMPADARYACPMETHPGESDPAQQGAYFSAEPGTCPWCGMALKPLDDLQWIKARRAASGAEVAYTCPDHQPINMFLRN